MITEPLRDELRFRPHVELVHQRAQVGERDQERLLEFEVFDDLRGGVGQGTWHRSDKSSRIGYLGVVRDTTLDRTQVIARSRLATTSSDSGSCASPSDVGLAFQQSGLAAEAMREARIDRSQRIASAPLGEI